MNIKINPEKLNDRKAVYNVNRLAFGREDEPRLVENLRDSESYVDGLSLVAENDGKIVGHVLFTKISIESYHENFSSITRTLSSASGLSKAMYRVKINNCRTGSLQIKEL